MYISEVQDYSPEPTGIGQKFIEQKRGEAIKREISELVDQEFDRLGEYAEEYISGEAASRATKFLERLLAGDPEAAGQFFGLEYGGGRYKLFGHDESKPWAFVINGEISQTASVKARQRLVEQYADLLRTEVVKDLEATVEGLRLQVVELEGRLDNVRRGNLRNDD